MAELAGDRSAPASTMNGDGSPDFAKLRQLLLEPEQQQLARLEDRLTDPSQRAADLAQVLPEALRKAKQKALREALEPILEKAIQSSVRRNPRELVEAMYPIIGPAIRTSIAAALREFAETLNQLVEKSVSVRAVRWRIEAAITGKPFSQILLSRSLLYSVEQVFLIHRKSGLLLQHVAAQGSVLKDADMISGMLTAIQDFLTDSFAEGGQELDTIDAGRFTLWIQYGPGVLLAGAVNGTPPAELRRVFRNALDGIQDALAAELTNFKGDAGVFDTARPYLEACLLGQSAAMKTKAAGLWIWAAAVVLILAAIFAWQIRQRERWNDYFSALKSQPGIVVTGIEKRGARYFVSGLKDPQAPDPAGMLAARGLQADGISYAWTPYLSLNTPFAAGRELNADRERIEREIIRFDPGGSKVAIAEAGRIDDLAASITRLLRSLPAVHIQITGRADDTGSQATNEKLSLDRAAQVAAALNAEGVPASTLQTLGVGNTQPLRPGDADWNRATNRSVSFRFVP